MDSLNSKEDKYTIMTESAQSRSYILNKNINVKDRSKFGKITPKNLLSISSKYPIKKQYTQTITTQRSSNLSRVMDQFNDKFLVDNLEKKQEQFKYMTSRLKNLLCGRKIKTSGEHFQDYKEEYKKVVGVGYNEIEKKFQLCQASLNEQRQSLMNTKIELQQNQKELNLLQDQIAILKEAIFLTECVNKKSLNEILFKNQLRQNKERKLTEELLEFVNQLSIQYVNHTQSMKEYLQCFIRDLNKIQIENEQTLKF